MHLSLLHLLILNVVEKSGLYHIFGVEVLITTEQVLTHYNKTSFDCGVTLITAVIVLISLALIVLISV